MATFYVFNAGIRRVLALIGLLALVAGCIMARGDKTDFDSVNPQRFSGEVPEPEPKRRFQRVLFSLSVRHSMAEGNTEAFRNRDDRNHCDQC